ncbi:MAG: DMT family protein [Hyphomicrobiales bacterium]|nr:DMT family protein [Hyphomicrobiales bacterium]
MPAFLPGLSPYLLPIALLVGSNVFMTTAWYWHLKYKEVPLISVIFISWALAFVEYCLAVPANRFGSTVYSAAQLKTMQEVITLVIFALFSTFYLKEALTWSQGFGFVLIAAGAFFVFHKL